MTLHERERIINQLNNKRYEELSENFQKFIKYMFNDIRKTDLILCRKYIGKKIDFVISVNNIEKNIAFTTGDIVNVYTNRVYDFVLFLVSINVSSKSILALLNYHYGDGTIDGSGIEGRSYGQLLKVDYQQHIKIVNEEFKNKELLSKVLDHVLIEENGGRNVDYFYHGDSRSGYFAHKDEVKVNIINEENHYKHDFMRIGVMNFLPLQRGIYKNDANRHRCVLRLNLKKYIKSASKS